MGGVRQICCPREQDFLSKHARAVRCIRPGWRTVGRTTGGGRISTEAAVGVVAAAAVVMPPHSHTTMALCGDAILCP